MLCRPLNQLPRARADVSRRLAGPSVDDDDDDDAFDRSVGRSVCVVFVAFLR